MQTIKISALAALIAAGTIGAAPLSRAVVHAESAVNVAAAINEPAYRDVVLPAGTVLPIALDSYVASDTSRVEDQVRAKLRRSIVVNRTTVLPAGTALLGHVTRVQRSGRVSGRGVVAFRFDRLADPSGERVAISTSAVSRLAKSGKSRDVKTIAIPAAGGILFLPLLELLVILLLFRIHLFLLLLVFPVTGVG